MIHRAIFGSMERITMVMIEHFAGAFPVWLSPDQVMVIPVTDKHNDYAVKIRDFLIDSDIRAQADLGSERMNYKIREAQESQIPYMLIVGDKEIETDTVNVRFRRAKEQEAMSVKEFLEKIREEVREKKI